MDGYDTNRDSAIEAAAQYIMNGPEAVSENDAFMLATVEYDAYKSAYDKRHKEAFEERKSQLVREYVHAGMDVNEAIECAKPEAEDHAKECANETATEAATEAREVAQKALFN